MIYKNSLILLDYISQGESPIFFFSRKDVAQFFNKPDHNLSLDELANCILKLWKKGFIYIRLNGTLIAPENIDKILWWLNNEKILRGNNVVTPFVGLTNNGGSVWEKAYKPCWHKFTQFLSSDNIKGSEIFNIKNEIIATDFNLIIEIINLIEKKTTELNIELKNFNKSNIFELKPFYPVYWKQLKVGYQLDFFINEKEEEIYDEFVWRNCIYHFIPEWKLYETSMDSYDDRMAD